MLIVTQIDRAGQTLRVIKDVISVDRDLGQRLRLLRMEDQVLLSRRAEIKVKVAQ